MPQGQGALQFGDVELRESNDARPLAIGEAGAAWGTRPRHERNTGKEGAGSPASQGRWPALEKHAVWSEPAWVRMPPLPCPTGGAIMSELMTSAGRGLFLCTLGMRTAPASERTVSAGVTGKDSARLVVMSPGYAFSLAVITRTKTWPRRATPWGWMSQDF